MDKSETETSNKDLLYDTKMLMYFLVFCIVIGEYENLKKCIKMTFFSNFRSCYGLSDKQIRKIQKSWNQRGN